MSWSAEPVRAVFGMRWWLPFGRQIEEMARVEKDGRMLTENGVLLAVATLKVSEVSSVKGGVEY